MSTKIGGDRGDGVMGAEIGSKFNNPPSEVRISGSREGTRGLGRLKLGWSLVGMVGTMPELGRGVKSEIGGDSGGGIVGSGSGGRSRSRVAETSD